MIICSCNVLSERDVRGILDAAGVICRAAQVYASLGRRPQCGRCARSIRHLIGDWLQTSDPQVPETGAGGEHCDVPHDRRR